MTNIKKCDYGMNWVRTAKGSRIALIVTVVFLSLQGCTKKVEDKVIGQWRDPSNPGETIEFFDDNTVLIVPSKGERMSGKWVAVGDARIKMDFSMLGITTTVLLEGIKIEEDEMIFARDGKSAVLERSTGFSKPRDPNVKAANVKADSTLETGDGLADSPSTAASARPASRPTISGNALSHERRKKIQENLRRIAGACDQFFVETQRAVANTGDIIGASRYLKRAPESIAGEDYLNVFPVKAGFQSIEVSISEGEVVAYSFEELPIISGDIAAARPASRPTISGNALTHEGKKKIHENLRRIASACDQFFIETGKTVANKGDIRLYPGFSTAFSQGLGGLPQFEVLALAKDRGQGEGCGCR